MSDVKDLSNLKGFERLYVTLMDTGEFFGIRLQNTLYDCYRANAAAFNAGDGNYKIQPIDIDKFSLRMATSKAAPYKREIQLIKALSLLEWNMDYDAGSPHYRGTVQLQEIRALWTTRFRERTGYQPTDKITSYSLCEETLNPETEPDYDFNPSVMQKLEDSHPRMVYICAPLRGDVEKNISFARQKAQEVFAEGDIPICPHLIFPPIADPADPVQDKAAMGMCLKLIERCHQVNVYGPEWTEGMWTEIHHAEHMKIPIYTDQKTLGKTKNSISREQSR